MCKNHKNVPKFDRGCIFTPAPESDVLNGMGASQPLLAALSDGKLVDIPDGRAFGVSSPFPLSGTWMLQTKLFRFIAHGVEPLTLYKTSVQESDIMCTHFAADETSYLFECELSNKTLIASVVRKEPAPSEEALTAALALTLPGVSILPIQVGLTLVCRGNLPSEYNYSLIFLK